MAELYDISASQLITNIVESCEPESELNQIVNYNRNGEVYIQIIGNPKVVYDVVCYIPRSMVSTLETGWSSGNIYRITMSHGTYNGRIIELSKDYIYNVFDGTTRQDYCKVNLKLAKWASS